MKSGEQRHRNDPKEKWPTIIDSTQALAVSSAAIFVPFVGVGQLYNHSARSWETLVLSFVGLHTLIPHLLGRGSCGKHQPKPQKKKTTNNYICNSTTTQYDNNLLLPNMKCGFISLTCIILSTLSCTTNGGLFLGMIDRTRTPSTKSLVVTRMWNL